MASKRGTPKTDAAKPYQGFKEQGHAVRASALGHEVQAGRRLPVSRPGGSLPRFLDNAAPELLPQILSNEIEFRSRLLARVAFLQDVLIEAIDQKAYDPERSSLEGLVREARSVVELTDRIVTKTKGLDTGDAKIKQVSGLLAREALLREELQRRGALDQYGRIVRPLGSIQPGTKAEDATATEPPPPPAPSSESEKQDGGV